MVIKRKTVRKLRSTNYRIRSFERRIEHDLQRVRDLKIDIKERREKLKQLIKEKNIR